MELMARKYSNAMLEGKCTDTTGQEPSSVSRFLVSSLLAMLQLKPRMGLHRDWSCAEEVRMAYG